MPLSLEAPGSSRDLRQRRWQVRFSNSCGRATSLRATSLPTRFLSRLASRRQCCAWRPETFPDALS